MVAMATLPNVIDKFYVILIRIPITFPTEIEKCIVGTMWEAQLFPVYKKKLSQAKL